MPLPNVPQHEYDELASLIASTDSPVGIDAKKTHVVILHLLLDLKRRIEKIESQLETESTGEI